MKHLSIFLSLALCALSCTEKTPEDWQLVWSEEFESGTLNETVWTRTSRGGADWAKTQSPDPRLVTFRDGLCVLSGIVNDDTDSDPSPYICGGIISQGKMAFEPECRIEVRARLHGAKGAWPAIWLMPDGGDLGWPHGGEIDIMERLNNNHIAYQTIHSAYTLHGEGQKSHHGTTAPINRDDFNVYGVEIHEDSISFFINGVNTMNYPRLTPRPQGQYPFIHPWYILIDMQLEGSWVGKADPADLPVEMEVDWVRYYKPIKKPRVEEPAPQSIEVKGKTLSLVWNDEFSTDGTPDPEKWGFEEGFVRNNEEQWYRPENAHCADGLLVIEGTADKIPNPAFTCAEDQDWRKNRSESSCAAASLNTRGKYSFRYGRLEVRAKIPVDSGAWPAIWTLGESYPWPSCGEIDLMECYPIDGVRQILANAAVGTDTPGFASWHTCTTPLEHFLEKDRHWAEKFHVWTMDWDEESLDLSLDGELLSHIPLSETINGAEGEGTNPFTTPQYILLNLALGGDHGGELDLSHFPLRYLVDYVRVYQ